MMASGNGGDSPSEVLNLGQGWFLKLSRLLAEGGFSYVYLGEDSSPQQQGGLPQLYAVKRMNVSTTLQKKSAMAEVDLIKQFNHSNIIQCITTHSTIRKHSSSQSTEFFYLVMEYCCPLPKTVKNEPLVGNIFKQCMDAVEYCHSFGLSHRDIKLENFMVGPDGYVKLIDFGSASTDIIKPEIDWSSKQRSIVEEELATVTTPMYRAPEIVSLWENYIIDSRVDIWALGCMLYLMWFGNHPFPDSNKLAILNGKYPLPEEEICPNFKKIITGLLQINPEDRLSFGDIKRLLVDYQVIKLDYVRPVFEDPIIPPNLMNSLPQQAASTTKSLFSSFKVGAESLFKNIRDNYYNPAAPGQNQKPPQATQPANRHADNDSTYGPAPPLPPKHSHQNKYGEDERVSSVLPSRPPPSVPGQPPSPKPPRPPKPASAIHEPSNVIPQRKPQPVMVDNLLNFGDDSTVEHQIDDINQTASQNDFVRKTDADLLSDLFSSNVTTSNGSGRTSNVPAPSVDLFSGMNNGSSNQKPAPASNNTNADLLGDLFGSGPSVAIGQEPIPPTANSGSAMPTSSSFTSLFLGGNLKPDELKKNVSSPNLTQLLGNGNAAGMGFSGFEFDLDLGPKPTSVKPTAGATTNVQANMQSQQGPNYSRSLFDDKPQPESKHAKQDLNAVFGEFLNDVGFTASNKPSTQTIGELRSESNTKDLDPITIQIRKWTKEGQNRKNIRALLSTLHTVTWPSCTWEEHPMSQMIQPIQVKKVYRRACLCVHPDKQVGTEWETLAKSIFIELNEAWSYFSQEEKP